MSGNQSMSYHGINTILINISLKERVKPIFCLKCIKAIEITCLKSVKLLFLKWLHSFIMRIVFVCLFIHKQQDFLNVFFPSKLAISGKMATAL